MSEYSNGVGSAATLWGIYGNSDYCSSGDKDFETAETLAVFISGLTALHENNHHNVKICKGNRGQRGVEYLWIFGQVF